MHECMTLKQSKCKLVAKCSNRNHVALEVLGQSAFQESVVKYHLFSTMATSIAEQVVGKQRQAVVKDDTTVVPVFQHY